MAERPKHEAHVREYLHRQRYSPMTAEQQALVADNTGLVWDVFRKAFPGLSADCLGEPDDVFQAGVIGLSLAAKRYDPERGIRFCTVACWWIRAEITKALDYAGLVRIPQHLRMGEWAEPETVRLLRSVVSLNKPLKGSRQDGDDTWTLGDTLAAPAAPERPEGLEVVLEAMRRLPPIDREVLEKTTLGGQTLRGLAGQMGLSKERVRQLKERARRRLDQLIRQRWGQTRQKSHVG